MSVLTWPSKLFGKQFAIETRSLRRRKKSPEMGFRFPRPSNHSQGEKRSQIIGASPPGGAREGVYNFTLIASPPLQSAEPVLATSSSSPYSSLPACTCLNKTSFLLCSANGPLKKKSSSSSLLLPFFQRTPKRLVLLGPARSRC